MAEGKDLRKYIRKRGKEEKEKRTKGRKTDAGRYCSERMLREEITKYLQETKEVRDPVRMQETIALCRELTREKKRSPEEERTAFLQYLSDIFRIDGREIVLLQVLMLSVSALGISSAGDVLALLPAFSPLFVLGMLPVLFRGRTYHMTEMEAATRASGAQTVLAKLILAGAANLVCMTLLLGMELIRKKAVESAGRMILYLFVPYLICLVLTLWSLRKKNREGMRISLVFTVCSCLVWGVLSKVCPWLYEASAMGIWLLLFVVSGAFFAKELKVILCAGKGGWMYGTVD